MDDLKKQLASLLSEMTQATKKIGLKDLQAQHQTLQVKMQDPSFWNDSLKAGELSKKEATLSARIAPWKKLTDELDDVAGLIELGDETMASELETQLQDLRSQISDLKSELKFSGPYDSYDVILSIYAGAGGTDAQDWTQMLMRMYVRWAEKTGLSTKIVDESPGEEAGLKSVTIELGGGSYLYGKLAGEHGVHRMVRKSPFNSAGSRETSFAKVDVMPFVDTPGEIDIDEKDLKVDVFRSGGAGGQSVNTTDSAVRVTHIPTGIAVAIQNERSQLQNKETAMKILRSRLVAMQLEQHATHLADLKGPTASAEFGSQIRNYILDDRIVKDLRTGYESHDPQKILDGDLDPLITAWLEKQF